MNQVGFVGRLVRTPELRKVSENKKMCYITVAVSRGFKNMNGEYETDFIDCVLWDKIAANAVKHCQKGDIISVRGRLQSRVYEKDGKLEYVMEVVGEKVSFISSSSSKPSDTSSDSEETEENHEKDTKGKKKKTNKKVEV